MYPFLKDASFCPFLFCAYDSSVLQNIKIFTHLLPSFSYKDPRLTEVTYHCINFNDRVRKVPKIYYLNAWNVSDPIVEVNAVVRHFRQPWVLIRVDTCNLMLT